MKIAIHERNGSSSDGWIKYCVSNKIPYKIVNCYDNDIVKQLSDCDGLMWHWQHYDPKAQLFARQLTFALEQKGYKVYPDSNTSWHFDDKIGQKYLFEAVGVEHVKTDIFYSKKEALNWLRNQNFPKVFKLSKGASGLNVKLVKSYSSAKKLVKKAFSSGFLYSSRSARVKDDLVTFKKNKNVKNFKRLIKGLIRIFYPKDFERFFGKEKGYIYFQDFIPKNNFDSRVVVMRDRCYAVRRYNRKNDFRASGSGEWAFGKELFDIKLIKQAFEIAKKLNLQSIAFDFLKDNDSYKVVEMSYCWSYGGSGLVPGYWDPELNWHDEEVNSRNFIIEDFILEIEKNKTI